MPRTPRRIPPRSFTRSCSRDKSPLAVTNRDDALLAVEARAKLQAMTGELDTLKKTVPPPIPYAMAASDGGVPGTKYAGFNDVAIHIRGRYDRLGEVVPRRLPAHSGRRKPAANHRGKRPAATGPLDRQRRQPADRPGDGQSHLAASLRRRTRAHAQQLRQARRAAHASGAARLSGRRIHSLGLVDQGDAPADHALGDLPAIEPWHAGDAKGRSRQSTTSAV